MINPPATRRPALGRRATRALATIAGVAVALAACNVPVDSHHAIDAAFGPELASQAKRVAHCESRLDPGAVSSGGGNHGLFQINNVHQGLVASMGYEWHELYDPYVNAEVAKVLYDQSGWSPWACRWAA